MTESYAQLAIDLFSAGYEPIPIPPGTKRCTNVGWPTMRLPMDPWPEDHGVGLRTGRHIGIDLDIYNRSMIDALLSYFRRDYDIITRTGQPPKLLVPVICPEIDRKIISDRYVDKHGVVNAIEVLTYGQMYLAYAVHPDTGKPYEWSSPLLDHAMPVVSADYVQSLLDLFCDYAIYSGWANISTNVKYKKSKSTYSGRTRPGDLFNAAHSITDLLPQYGWTYYGANRWTRPGKKRRDGPSASVLEDAVLYVFSTSIPELESGRAYDAYGLYTHYEHDGDFGRSAQVLNELMRQA